MNQKKKIQFCKLILARKSKRNVLTEPYFFPMAKVTTVEWFLVKKYFPPGSNTQSSLSDRCTNPACFKRFFASSTKKIFPNQKRTCILKKRSWEREKDSRVHAGWRTKEVNLRWSKRELGDNVGLITDGVEVGGRSVEEIDEIESDRIHSRHDFSLRWSRPILGGLYGTKVSPLRFRLESFGRYTGMYCYHIIS